MPIDWSANQRQPRQLNIYCTPNWFVNVPP